MSRWLDRALRPVSRVEPGEGAQAGLLLVCAFLSVVGLGLHQLGLRGRELAGVKFVLVVVLAAVWLAIAIGIAHRHRMLAARPTPEPAPSVGALAEGVAV